MARLFDLPIHHAARWIFNCYVVEAEADRPPLVVDAGLPCTAAQAAQILRELAPGKEGPAVTVVATHGHSDHVGGIPTLQAEVRAEVALPARCERYLQGERPRSPGPREVAKILPVLGDQPFDWGAVRDLLDDGARRGYGRSPTMRWSGRVDRYLADGDDLGGGWEVLHTPGHTDDSTCLYHRPSATLLSGDAVLTYDGRAWFNPEVVDRGASSSTEERLRALDVRHLLPGHGQPLAGRHLLRDARSFRDRPPRGGALCGAARLLGRW